MDNDELASLLCGAHTIVREGPQIHDIARRRDVKFVSLVEGRAVSQPSPIISRRSKRKSIWVCIDERHGGKTANGYRKLRRNYALLETT